MTCSNLYPRVLFLTLFVLMSAGLFGVGRVLHQSAQDSPSQGHSTTLLKTCGKLPLAFEANQGQVDDSVKFLAHGNGYTLFITATGPVLSFGNRANQRTLRLHLMGTHPHPLVVGLDELPGKTNYILGKNPRLWHINIPTYGRVMYQNVYSGINLVYYGNQSHLEYDFMVQPGASPGIIRLNFEGAKNVRSDTQGNLVLSLPGGEVFQPKPFIYQEIGNTKNAVAGRYVLLGTNQIGFALAVYDPTKPLIIDPVLTYSTYLGGNGDDQAYGIAIDSSGNAYVVGYTYSTNFPIKNAYQGALKGPFTVFVSKLNASGNALVYSTYLGGSSGDYGQGIAVDSAGNAYLTGYTESTNFPTVNPFQGQNHTTNGFYTGFISKLNASGSALVYSTYLGGSYYDQGAGIAVDSAGNAYVTGTTGSADFPTKNAIQSKDRSPGIGTAFVSKLNASGSALVYSTFLGGSSVDVGNGTVVDSLGNVYVTGFTQSTDFPTKNALQGSKRGPENAFATKINASGSAFIYSTYLGGSGHDIGYSITADSSGWAYITGYTDSTNFPVVNAIQPTKIAFADVFISELKANGSALIFSTYLGGSSYDDQGNSIAVDSAGNMYLTGYTQSKKFPTKNPLQGTFGGGSYDAFVAKIGP